jgi:hypothetical protein
MPRTLLDLNLRGAEIFDGSTAGMRITTTGSIDTSIDGGLAMTRTGRVRVKRDERLDTLEAFTLEAEIEPAGLGRTQVLVDSQSPPIRLTLDRSGVVTGAVHTEDGWTEVKADRKLGDGPSTVRLLRDGQGKVILELDGKAAGSAASSGALKAVGRGGMSIGTDGAGESGFEGTITGVRLLDSAITSNQKAKLLREATKLRDDIAGVFGVGVHVITQQGEVDHRFNDIKAVMRAAGVEDLSSLSTLRITQPTHILPGTILKASAKATTPNFNWADIAAQFSGMAATDRTGAKKLLDTHLLARTVDRADAIELDLDLRDVTIDAGAVARPLIGTATARVAGGALADGGIAGGFTLRDGGTSTLRPEGELDLTRFARGGAGGPNDRLTLNLSLIESLGRLDRDEPDAWPVMAGSPMMVMKSNVLPINSAVIIAQKLDLTNQVLEIDPAVGTLYIIVEEIEARSGAAITWKRTPITRPDIGPDPSLDGLDRHGVDLAPHSKHGLPGGDARSGAPGLSGQHGQDAPNVEIWALRANGMPDIDLEGQRGGEGGRGQRGGEGGNGAQGRAGEWAWFFGRHCWDDPGNGGDGGHGGNGGNGARAGNGGDGGKIMFAVLAETLPQLTTSNAFSVDVGRGPGGEGGPGGARGPGGRGGARGFTEVCDGGKRGAEGQPGHVGSDGSDGAVGGAGEMQIITITQEAWDEQLTRPWLYDVTPDAALPGTSIVVKGSRFADTDQVVLGSTVLGSTLRADGGLDVVLPTAIAGGSHMLFLRRHDGEESNRLPLVIRPQLTGSLPALVPGTSVTLAGRAFLAGAVVDHDGDLYPANVGSATSLSFMVPDTAAGSVVGEQSVSLALINPDGQRSNALSGVIPRVLHNGFQLGVHDFQFANDSNGTPSWSTFEDTFGAVEVWHEVLDPVFGHPILTGAFYLFYEHFLKGTDNGGLATGFCTSLASMALDRFWQGNNNTFATVTRDAAFRRQMTAVHGRLLSRESLLDFHDQGRRGNANVISTFREIESTFESGGTRETAPMLFFVPAGAAWDAGYFDMLADSHCIVPTRIVYPEGHTGASIDGIRMFCWDNNHPNTSNCFVDFRVVGGETLFTYTANGAVKFRSEDGITLAVSTLGEYLLRDHDLPFGGPFGLSTFVVDFLLSPATLQVVDSAGRMTGRVGGQILSEIPDSHPAYLMPGAYLLPKNVGLTRRITGTESGTYGHHSVHPDGLSTSLSNVPTSTGEVDRVLANADGSRVRVVPGSSKSLNLTIGRRVGDVARGVTIDGFGATPAEDLDVTATPDLSMVRVSNRGGSSNVDVRLLGFDVEAVTRETLDRGSISLPAGHDLVVAVSDWENLTDANVTTTTVQQ